jgi:hypothetical protein
MQEGSVAVQLRRLGLRDADRGRSAVEIVPAPGGPSFSTQGGPSIGGVGVLAVSAPGGSSVVPVTGDRSVVAVTPDRSVVAVTGDRSDVPAPGGRSVVPVPADRSTGVGLILAVSGFTPRILALPAGLYTWPGWPLTDRRCG